MTPGSRRPAIACGSLILLYLLFSGLSFGADASGSNAQQPIIAIIIDDLGHLRVQGQRAAALNGPVACAILPHTAHAALLAQQAHANGKEVLLHLPLQSMEMSQSAGPGQISLDSSHAQLNELLQQNIDAIPHIQGINTHMGSLVTRHPGHMRWLMEAIDDYGNLFFVDSFTTPSSVGFQLALEQGVPATRRHIFLDNVQNRKEIDFQFERLLKRARRDGYAVGIGHPYRVTLDYLEDALNSLPAQGVSLVSVETVIQRQTDSLQQATENLSAKLNSR
ncbi:MAG: divergent polysaccharide deacetylase family protein [Gammaproteobacteria bacterium]